MYLFRAERYNLAVCPAGHNNVLFANLREVLANLQGNPARFDRFNEAVRHVLPQIQQVSVHTISRGQPSSEILVWTGNPALERDDLAFSLNESGTGVGQVLAMLYVVINSPSPRTILIDEPQSFLHPGAVRRLLSILREFPQHQYVLASHSPLVITASEPSTLTQVQQEGARSTFRIIDPRKNEHLRELLADVGARLSDVFGADAILWVEGQTEELCFPVIVEQVARIPLRGTAIVGVRNTGDLEGKQADAAYEIYRRLSQADSSLLPPAVGFLFDREQRSQQQMEDLEKRSKGLVRFLSRRMYESYLLNADAVAAVANVIDGFRDKPLTAEEVQRWIDQHRTEKVFGGTVDQTPGSDWRVDIDGAKLLRQLFGELSETRVSYEKTTHSVALTRWIIANASGELQGLSDLLEQVVDGSQA